MTLKRRQTMLLDRMQEEDMAEPVPEEELKLIHSFLDRFILSSDTTTKEQIDLTMALRALPERVSSFNLYKIEFMNFNLV